MRLFIKKIVGSLAPSNVDVITQVINQLLKNNKSVQILDIGGGSGKLWTENSCLVHLIEKKILQVNIFDAQIPETNKNSVLTFHQGFVPEDLAKVKKKTFDLVLAIDLIEHLPRDKGYLMLYQMERLSKHFCFIFTPNGFVYQSPDPLNIFNAHISGWTPKELKEFGYTKFRGHSGLKFFFGAHGLPKWEFNSRILHNVWVLTHLVSRILVTRFPGKSFAFSGIKRVESIEKEFDLSRINKTDC